MRPLRLELEGFTSFRERTEIDLEDSDYFVLVGDTGAGKSSIIDAVCFALYGCVPRYDDRRVVAPVVTQGYLEAKVRLDFALADKTYTAVRVVRRQGRGATTKEARLECGGEVLAGNADELTEEVTKLLGLSFDHFIKCIVLPQGEFARFLHDKPAERQDMVVKLLNLGIYERMRASAQALAAKLKAKVELNESRLANDFGEATRRALADAQVRVRDLEQLNEKVLQAAPRLRALEEEQARARSEVADAEQWIGVLAALSVPQEVARLADDLRHAEKLASEARTQATEVGKSLAAAEQTLVRLPPRVPLDAARRGHSRREELIERKGELERAEREARSTERRARAAREERARELGDAVAAWDEARARHAAEHLAAGLKAGESCPVCLQEVRALKARPPPADLERNEAAVARAQELLAEGDKLMARAGEELAANGARAEEVRGHLAALEAELVDHRDAAAVERALSEIDAAETRVRETLSAFTRTQEASEEAAAVLGALGDREQGLWRELDARRDALAVLAPPPVGREDLGIDWRALKTWAEEQVVMQEKRAEKAAARVSDLEAARALLSSEIGTAIAACGLDAKDDPHTTVSAALAHSRAERDRISNALEEARRLKEETGSLRTEHEVSHNLAHHLSARGFEKWIVNEALQRLVVGASDILKQLSEGRYSVTIDDHGNFLVIDHDNTDERRSARTLSGGETFLASLGLALALSEELKTLAADGAARLEAIFLDEGFGALDPQTLETVAATMENLATTGRMVGIVTHVRELADRVPLQFRVHKDGHTSRVEKVPS